SSARAAAAAALARVAIEAISPAVDDGAFPVKRIAGERVVVEADLICDGHDKLSGAVQWRGPMQNALGDPAWNEVAMVPLGNDRWQASFPVATLGLYEFRVLGWRDAYETFRDEIAKKHAAGVPIALEIQEGTEQIVAARARHQGDELDWPLTRPLYTMDGADEATRLETLLAPETADAMRRADTRPGMCVTGVYTVDAERTGAGFASWFEVFPRSMSDDVSRHGTFADVERHLPRIAAMGFDVLYFPPIHPIGRTNRKGPNNTLTPAEGDPGSPYAIGTAGGGHDALHPELGTLEDFLHLREAAAGHGLELAIDFAIQCSPDHPWLREHRDWFAWRPDGSIRYAENPPKKYQDIVNVDFYAEGAIPDLWVALAKVVLFWAGQGIRLFRVDNPHTKPLPFWQWMITEVRARFPDAVFLAEAFTRPKVMNRLAKIGFSQSYTYFTWRNTRPELEEYLTTLTTGPEREYFRPHFFVNTPDINPTFLQTGGRAGHLVRAALAATLSGLWGVYNGFELCEATPLAPGKEEYLDSEKFQLRAWDTARPGNIVSEITRLNHIRRANPALHRTGGLAFLPSSDPAVIAYEKATDDRGNVICCFVSLDPHAIHDTRIELPLWKSGLPGEAHVEIEDLMSGVRFGLDGAWHDLRLTPDMPFILWRLVT
ncbi:alpha-1,4-glucan--maltose-1-phosphate maltosyltransferase, partial [Endobacter medicaginis]